MPLARDRSHARQYFPVQFDIAYRAGKIFRMSVGRNVAQNPKESSFIYKISKFQGRLTLKILSKELIRY